MTAIEESLETKKAHLSTLESEFNKLSFFERLSARISYTLSEKALPPAPDNQLMYNLDRTRESVRVLEQKLSL